MTNDGSGIVEEESNRGYQNQQRGGARTPFSRSNRIARFVWSLVVAVLFCPSPRWCYGWRRLLLRCFGATISSSAIVHPSVRIWAPWNLTMEPRSCLAWGVDCYCVAPIRIGCDSVVSQYAHLCSASHDACDSSMPLVSAPIDIGDSAWICAGAFIGMGVSVGSGAVVAARGVVVKDVPRMTVVGGNPAVFLKKRKIRRD